ncbi:helix-turn-helix transcriptional regulator [Arthrobacter sp. Sa2BUA2]|uniref:Helix-turn-helix transcriptional regulator n=1 Tax=Arthrobacter pullicola TaxID=2762224 RepID=A0ABR8YG60_9MICC|nr:helix-turn-helix domain-containing protein [Arthrobacter pullicola]MBD8043200.1 helix-turn-helix transcriptional regulator [Arthrobacter pullicola]
MSPEPSGPSAPLPPEGVTYRGPSTEQVISDPIRIRALAHPVRLELLDYLDDAGQATATECAAATGESVASCSYHLRMLAKHGYIEQADQQGREKPWKVVSRGRSSVIDRNAPGSVHAVSAMAGMFIHRQLDRIQSWLQRAPELPVEDIDVSTITSSRFHATHEEIRQFREEVWELARRFDERREHPELRPEGSVPVQLFAVVNIDPDQPAHQANREAG